ncbi:unnamed protein product [Pleuronectes platessa]|uniref:Uncharacterized protein n=1 Tax=Pleuronectes platessa TaxID=8262 RepID=A0A9N7YZA6_PLEPL|nr:unnamed protein product [Pleuronectes platessa]
MRANGRVPGKQNQCPGLLSGAPVGLVVATEISAGPNRANFSCSWNGIQLRLFCRDEQRVWWHPAGLWPNTSFFHRVLWQRLFGRWSPGSRLLVDRHGSDILTIPVGRPVAPIEQWRSQGVAGGGHGHPP